MGLNRTERRRLLKDKSGCLLCRGRFTGTADEQLVSHRGFTVHATCAEQYDKAKDRRRAERMGLDLVEAGDLLRTVG